MTLGMLGAGLWAAGSITGLIIHLIGIGDRELRLTNRLENDAWWTLGGLSFLIVTTFFATIACGIALERSWVRPLVPAFWFYGTFETLLFHQTVQESLSWFLWKLTITVGVGGFACWYFYMKPNVVNYYATLAQWRLSQIEDP